jgi:hypothetical protein
VWIQNGEAIAADIKKGLISVHEIPVILISTVANNSNDTFTMIKSQQQFLK